MIVLTCFFMAAYGRYRKLGVGFPTAGYGRHRSQWVKQKLFSLLFFFVSDKVKPSRKFGNVSVAILSPVKCDASQRIRYSVVERSSLA